MSYIWTTHLPTTHLPTTRWFDQCPWDLRSSLSRIQDRQHQSDKQINTTRSQTWVSLHKVPLSRFAWAIIPLFGVCFPLSLGWMLEMMDLLDLGLLQGIHSDGPSSRVLSWWRSETRHQPHHGDWWLNWAALLSLSLSPLSTLVLLEQNLVPPNLVKSQASRG